MKKIVLEGDLESLASLFNALGNPVRIKIMEILAEKPEAIVADIVERLPLAQSTVSQHLAVLQAAGLIHDDRAGSGRCCRVNPDALAEFSKNVVGWTMRLAAAGDRTVNSESC